MSETLTSAGRDTSGRFQNGHRSLSPGRPKGSRSRLGEAFIEDLRNVWNERGIEALRACAETDPGQFCRIVSSLLPKTIDLNMKVDATQFVGKFRAALALMGNEDEAPKPRRLREARVIEHERRD